MSVVISIVAILALCISFFAGVKEGAVKHAFSLASVIIAIPLAGLSYEWIAKVLSFLPGTNWENFIGFWIAMAIIIVILHFAFIIPRRMLRKTWKKGYLFHLLGGPLNVLNAATGMALFTLLLGAYPIFDWLERWVSHSSVMDGLAQNLSYVSAMLPQIFQ